MTAFITGEQSDKAKLNTAWDVEVVNTSTSSFDISGEETAPTGVDFKDDGKKMFVIGTGSTSIHQYTLSTAWDVTTATFDSVSLDVSSEDSSPQDLKFKPDGTKLFIVGDTNDSIFQYSLSTAWDVGTASFDSASFDVSGEDATPVAVYFKPDGTVMFVLGDSNDSIFQYTLSTAWDVSTASSDSVSFDISSEDSSPSGLGFKDDGTKMFILGNSNDSVFQYTLSTAWDVGTASADEDLEGDTLSFDVSGEDTAPLGFAFSDDGTEMYIAGNSNDSVFQYTLDNGTSDMVAANLQDIQPTDVWRAEDLDNAFVEVKTEKVEKVNFVVVAYHNLTTDGAIRVRGASKQGDLTSNPAFDSGPVEAVSAIEGHTLVWSEEENNPERLAYDRNHFILDLSSAESLKWWRIDFFDSNNPDGFVEAGRMFINRSFKPTRAFKFNWGIRWKDGQRRLRSRGGQIFPDVREPSRRLQGDITWNNEAEVWEELFRLERLQATTKDIMVVMDEDNRSRLQDWSVMGLFTDLQPVRHIGPDIYETTINIEELI